MKYEINYEIFDMEKHGQLAEQAAVVQAADMAANPATVSMLPYTLETFQQCPLGAIASTTHGEFVGFNGVIYQYETGEWEQGGLYVAPQFRGHGVAWELKIVFIDAAKAAAAGKRLITFVGPTSESINKKFGFTETDSFPAEALEFCATCPKSKCLPVGKVCCSKVLEIQL